MLPVMLMIGRPATVANGTNRLPLLGGIASLPTFIARGSSIGAVA